MDWLEAARKGNRAELTRHLKNRQPVDQPSNAKLTALRLAAENGQTGAVKLLLKHGANPNLHADGVAPPLTAAIKRDHWDTAAALVQGGADPNVDGVAALVLFEPPKRKLFKLMLEHGLDPNGSNEEYGPYLRLAITDPQCAQMILHAKADIRRYEKQNKESLLFHVASKIDRLRQLLKMGADVNLPIDKDTGQTILMWAAQCLPQYATPLIRLFIAHGADINRKDKSGRTALDHAWQAKADQNIHLLEQLGAQSAPPRELLKKRPANGDELSKRRGTLGAFDEGTWDPVAIELDGQADAILKQLAKTIKGAKIRTDLTEAALSGKLAPLDAHHLALLELKNQTWAPIAVSFRRLLDETFPQTLARITGRRVIWCGHQKTASSTFFMLWEGRTLLTLFESAGQDYRAQDDLDLQRISSPTRFTSKLHKPDWWRQHKDENQTLQSLVREQDAYVPRLLLAEQSGKLVLPATPPEILHRDNLKRLSLLAFPQPGALGPRLA